MGGVPLEASHPTKGVPTRKEVGQRIIHQNMDRRFVLSICQGEPATPKHREVPYRECAAHMPRRMALATEESDARTPVAHPRTDFQGPKGSIGINIGQGWQGLWFTRGLSNHFCEIFENLPLKKRGLVFGKPIFYCITEGVVSHNHENRALSNYQQILSKHMRYIFGSTEKSGIPLNWWDGLDSDLTPGSCRGFMGNYPYPPNHQAIPCSLTQGFFLGVTFF